MKTLLSVLTPTIRGRENQVSILLGKIESQITKCGTNQIEHLVLLDNRMRSIGAKRQALVDIARGDFFAFVDDDDDISDDYVSSLLLAIERNPDVVTFRQRAIYNGLESEVHYGVNNPDQIFNVGGITLRAPWHVCAWKRERIDGCLFSDVSYGEDLAWCQQARKRIKTGTHIDKVLHTYRHDSETTAAPEPR